MRSLRLHRILTASVIVVTGTMVTFAGGYTNAAPVPPATQRTDRQAGPLTGTAGRGNPDIATSGSPRPRSGSVTPNTASGTINCPGGCSVNMRSGPSTGYGAVGSLANGTRVNIYCTARGEWIQGQYGDTNLWDNV